MGLSTYDRIGRTYHHFRRADPRISSQIWSSVDQATRVLDVGAGQGSYERPGCVAVEPSQLMLSRRPSGSAPAVQAVAEQLPFTDGSFDGAMAVLTVHHWSDPEAGLTEVRRVTDGPVAVLTWDAEQFNHRFWLVRDYVPEAVAAERAAPSVAWIASVLAPARVEVVPIPHDCSDGFSAAYWRRPEMYLDAGARAAISNLALLDQAVADRLVSQLSGDLASGAWRSRNRDLLERDEFDFGYRLVVGSGGLERRRKTAGGAGQNHVGSLDAGGA